MARAALDEHLPLLTERGKRHRWLIDMDHGAGICHVGMSAPFLRDGAEEHHSYLLRFSFDYYPIEQPGLVFVNPENREIGSATEFESWWPNIDGNPWINVQINPSDHLKSYLCFQWTQEFKQTHGALAADDPKKWDPEKHNVVGVAEMVQRALRSSWYKGYRKSP